MQATQPPNTTDPSDFDLTMTTPTTTALIPLSLLPDNVDATSSSFTSTHAPPAMIKSVWATLELLAPAAPSLFYAPAHFALVSSENQSVDQQAAFGVQSFLEELTRASFEVATSLLCSSILAGQGSESDEYGDVGIWVGTLEQRDPWEVLSKLGLKEWIQSKGGKIVTLDPSPSPLPAALMSTSGSQSAVAETPKIHMDALSRLLNNVESTLEFRVEGLGGGVVLYFFVGQLSAHGGGFGKDVGYAGLIGVGVMADGED